MKFDEAENEKVPKLPSVSGSVMGQPCGKGMMLVGPGGRKVIQGQSLWWTQSEAITEGTVGEWKRVLKINPQSKLTDQI